MTSIFLSKSFTPSSIPSLFKTKTRLIPSLASNPMAVTFLSAILTSGSLPSVSTSISKLILLIFGTGWSRSSAQFETSSWNCFVSVIPVFPNLSKSILFIAKLVSSDISKSCGIIVSFSIL